MEDVNFDALVQKTKEAPIGDLMSALNTLYGHAFALPQWHFIARGQVPDVHPYIASNAEFADGKPMIRAFTDTVRLQRFVQENQLQDADGSSLVLSIPTEEIVPYLEQFMDQGAYGLWFNSDAASYGFFVPLQQLRPIKEHLENIQWQAVA